MKRPNLGASVRQRLLNLSNQHKWDFNRLLVRYGVERFLRRLSESPHADRFLLKGAMLFTVWEGSPHRATRDLDLLGLLPSPLEELRTIFGEVVATPIEPDGLEFGEVRAEPIRATMEAGGIRALVDAELAGARIHLQIDVGFGDAVTPRPVTVEFPGLLDFPRARLRAYPPETVIAEKLEAMVRLDAANSRLKDFFDLWHLSRTMAFDGTILTAAVVATFSARRTETPLERITAFGPKFSEDTSKRRQWEAFLRQSVLKEGIQFGEVVNDIRIFLEPIVAAAAGKKPAPGRWSPGAGWSPISLSMSEPLS